MTPSSPVISASGCTILTGNDEVSLYLREELDTNAALAWWHRHQDQTTFPLLSQAALQHDIRLSTVPLCVHNSGI
ncbi:uncharacterized protein LACBIDRAFT_317426 [Laccaria bicolor S238N-H82]|uniref:Predicted protein n=1 Tax=Laccaria bicolor (strain S238N-H82 / ATCC MYA-4686) TaxID=486041 RepID=B0D552_LACBS|nr:uncharacterized protein LACBIDRAFT_317426 [Laccaria bicolor S238N-H82]EDR10678.1 predicted protein [Laccaria bicolor S238N-H82]|eukprot:XP_001879128.1 predicted protein [Laccaria bicolor S238N-H82]